ncbi:MAG: hypothetical protein ABEJ68_08540 [Halobacteriaceae archaeon]
MVSLDADDAWRTLYGDPRPRWALLGFTVTVLGLASVAFLLGFSVGLYEFAGWLVLVVALPTVAGVVGAGLLPTALSLWLVILWGYVFPPLVGYLTGAWAPASRYGHPRMAGYAYVSARAELHGALDYVLGSGVWLALVLGILGYGVGSLVLWAAKKSQTV